MVLNFSKKMMFVLLQKLIKDRPLPNPHKKENLETLSYFREKKFSKKLEKGFVESMLIYHVELNIDLWYYVYTPKIGLIKLIKYKLFN